jgi:predicted MFS family arabinose efflux permease
MAATQAKMRRIAIMVNSLVAAAVFGFSLVLAAGKGRDWALPTVLAIIAVVAIVGIALIVRVQRAQNRDR